MNLWSMAATWARVAWPWGARAPSMPPMMPLWVAHSMALSAQEDTESPSEKARKFPLTAGLPAARYSMAASCSRVMLPSGSAPSETPALTAQDWAAAYQGLQPSTLWPFSRASTVQIMARVVAASGEKAAALVPVIMPLALT